MPQHAKLLTDLLEEKEAWKNQVSSIFVATRTASGMNQAGFAQALDISAPYLNQIEHGKRTPSSETLGKLRSFVEGSTTSADQDQSQDED